VGGTSLLTTIRIDADHAGCLFPTAIKEQGV
jgi:hypothetical protein